jgi:CRISPR-associated protein Cas2
MRTTYLVCYDITDDKRLRKVFKTCVNFGDHLQYSVFECDLNPSEKLELETALGQIIKHDEDQVIFVTLGPAEGRPRDYRAGPALHQARCAVLRDLRRRVL